MNTFLAALFWTALSIAGVSAQQIAATGDQHAILDEARQLLTKSAQLAGGGQRLEAVQTAQTAANELRGLQPPADGQTAYLWLFTQALYTWTVRLIEAGRPEEAAAAAHETVEVAGQAAASPDADASAIASLMLALSSQLATAGLRPGAVDAARAAVDIMREEAARRKSWGERMSQIPAPRDKGCFRATYPNGWQQVPCVEAPNHPYPPASGGGFNVGNGTDWTATVAGATPISSATGSFDSVTGVTSETGTIFGSGPNCPNPVAGIPNIFSLQLNTKPFNASSLCNNAANQPGAQPPRGSANPLCQGWQQFIYSSTSNIVFMQYWLLNYKATILVNGLPQPACPTGWSPSSGGCFVNSPATSVPAQTIANLRQMSLTASANSAFDSVKILITGNAPSVSVSNQDSVLNLAPNWQDAEFNVFGDSCNSQANFNTGSTIVVRTQVNAGAKLVPACTVQGFTGETNNLNLVGTPATVQTSGLPAIVFTESNAVGGTPRTCTVSKGGLFCVGVSSSGSTNCTDAGGVASTCASVVCPQGLTLTGGGGACAAGGTRIKSLFPRANGSFNITCEKQGVDPQAVAICCRM